MYSSSDATNFFTYPQKKKKYPAGAGKSSFRHDYLHVTIATNLDSGSHHAKVTLPFVRRTVKSARSRASPTAFSYERPRFRMRDHVFVWDSRLMRVLPAHPFLSTDSTNNTYHHRPQQKNFLDGCQRAHYTMWSVNNDIFGKKKQQQQHVYRSSFSP